jgi:hypothetical protein
MKLDVAVFSEVHRGTIVLQFYFSISGGEVKDVIALTSLPRVLS